MARLAWRMLTALSAALPVHQQRRGPSHIASFQCTQPSAPRYRRALLMATPCSPHAFGACCKHAAWPGHHGVTATSMSIQHIYHAYASPVSSLCSGSVGDKRCEAWFACNLLAVTGLYTVHSAHGPWSGWCPPTPVATRIQE